MHIAAEPNACVPPPNNASAPARLACAFDITSRADSIDRGKAPRVPGRSLANPAVRVATVVSVITCPELVGCPRRALLPSSLLAVSAPEVSPANPS